MANPIAEAVPHPSSTTVEIERLLSVEEFAKLEDLSPRSVYEGVRTYGWPHYRRGPKGKVIKFSVAQILEIREMQRVPANPTARSSRRRPRNKRANAS